MNRRARPWTALALAGAVFGCFEEPAATTQLVLGPAPEPRIARGFGFELSWSWAATCSPNAIFPEHAYYLYRPREGAPAAAPWEAVLKCPAHGVAEFPVPKGEWFLAAWTSTVTADTSTGTAWRQPEGGELTEALGHKMARVEAGGDSLAMMLWAYGETRKGRSRGPTDLGVARAPAAAPDERIRWQTWPFLSPDPSLARLGYALASEEESSVAGALERFARSTGFKDRGDQTYSASFPKGCGVRNECVMRTLASHSAGALTPLIERFRARAEAEKLNAIEATQMIVRYVQHLKYAIPDVPFGVLPPALAAWYRRGDCDSKALLAALLLAGVGVEAVVLSSDAAKHATLGVNLPVGRDAFEAKGKRWAFVEVTNPGWPLGERPPEYASVKDWVVRSVQPARAPAAAPPRRR